MISACLELRFSRDFMREIDIDFFIFCIEMVGPNIKTVSLKIKFITSKITRKEEDPDLFVCLPMGWTMYRTWQPYGYCFKV